MPNLFSHWLTHLSSLVCLWYGLRALRQAPRLLRMYAPVKFALRANFYAPQGCFQSLKLTSSLRDCGHRHGTVSLCPADLNGLPSRAYTPCFLLFHWAQSRRNSKAKRMLLRDYVPRRHSPVSGCLSKLNVLTSRPHILLLFTFSLGAVAPQFKSKKNALIAQSFDVIERKSIEKTFLGKKTNFMFALFFF